MEDTKVNIAVTTVDVFTNMSHTEEGNTKRCLAANTDKELKEQNKIKINTERGYLKKCTVK